MNQDLQNLEIKVENNGVTPQGRVSATEWNIVVSALKDLDLGGGGGVADFVAWSNVTDKPTWIGAEKPTYSYSEILETPDLGGFVTAESLTELLLGKADTATTLAGYGITDAYTKDELNTEFKKYMLKDAAQSITAQHDFTKGLLIDGLAIRKSADKTFYFDGNLVVSGAMTMFGKDSTTFPTIWANIPFNKDHMTWDGSQWNVEGGGGGASVTKDAIVSALGYTPLSANGGTISGRINFNNASYPDIRGNGSYITFSPDDVSGSKGSVGLYKNTDGSFALRRVCDHYSYGVMDLGASGYRWHTVYAKSGNFSDNVAIGGTTADEKLHVHGNMLFDGACMLKSSLTGEVLYMGSSYLVVGGGTTAKSISTYIDGKNVFIRAGNYNAAFSDAGILRWNGNVAIGGDTADEKLHVYGNILTTGNITAQGHIDAKSLTLSGVTTLTNYKNKSVIFGSSSKSSYIDGSAVYIRTGTTSANTFYFTPEGNFGIGTTPSEKLHVNGNALISDSLTVAGVLSTYKGSSSVAYLHVTNETTTIDYAHLFVSNLDKSRTDRPLVMQNGYGNVAVGGITASEKLSIYGNVALASGSANPYISIKDDTGAMWYVQYARDRLWFGAGPAKSLSVDRSGNVVIFGALTFFSQASLKNVINHEGLSLDELAKIRPARFKWKDGRDDRVHVGVIAENILPILPEVVYFTGEEKTKTVDYASLATHIGVSLIQPVVNLAERVKDLEAEVKTLKQENNKLKQLVA